MIRNKKGAWGEIYASRYLRDMDYKILSANYICRFGEIDIVAQKDDTIYFVEVKTRNEKTDIRPMEAVDANKRQKLELTAENFIANNKVEGKVRFDVCEVYVDDNDDLSGINYIENAF